MFACNPLLLVDYYKTTHPMQHNPNITKLVSYYTPRMSRLKDTDKVCFFGLQGFIKDYLEYEFNDFFITPQDIVMEEYTRTLDNTLGEGAYDPDKILALHNLGYLPLEICAVPEGMRTAIGVPQIEITNTHPDFAWLVNTIESLLSSYMWHTQVSAEVGYRYRQIVNKYHQKTVDNNINPGTMLGDFSFRGQHSPESAVKSSAAWLLSFFNSATVPAIPWLEEFYNCDSTVYPVGFGAISTEHSVMCSNYAIDGDEETFIRKLLTEIYPHHNFSMVSDSYDYWNLVDNILPKLKKEIFEHDGCLAVRGDSGDPVQVVTDTVFHLWDTFGGSYNSKGYKILDPHVKAIYGDSITPQRCEEIYQILEEEGFAANNVSLGVGSFSMMCLENIHPNGINVSYSPYTRDTFGIAVKATYAELNHGEKYIFIQKAPKECNWKASQKGCCIVNATGDSYIDGQTYAESRRDNLLTTVWKDGKFVKEYTLEEVRRNLHG